LVVINYQRDCFGLILIPKGYLEPNKLAKIRDAIKLVIIIPTIIPGMNNEYDLSFSLCSKGISNNPFTKNFAKFTLFDI